MCVHALPHTCMYIHIHTYTYVCTYIHRVMHANSRMQIDTHVCLETSMHAQIIHFGLETT